MCIVCCSYFNRGIKMMSSFDSAVSSNSIDLASGVNLTNNANLWDRIFYMILTMLTMFIVFSTVIGRYVNTVKHFLFSTLQSLKLTFLPMKVIIQIMFNESEDGFFSVLLQTLSNYMNTKTPCFIWLGYFTIAYVSEPDDLQVILSNEQTLEKSTFYEFTKEAVGHGIVTAPVSIWRRNRRLLTPFFNTRNLKSYFNAFNVRSAEIISKLRAHCDAGIYCNLWDPISYGTYSMLFDLAFGLGTKCITDEEKEELSHTIVKISQVIGNRLLRMWLHPNFMYKAYLSVTGDIKYFNFMKKKTKEILNEIRTNIKTNNQSGQDMSQKNYVKENHFRPVIENLVRMNEKGTGYTNEEDICNEANTIIAAGSETNAITICFTLVMLSMHPEVQEKVYSEIMAILGDEERFIEYDDVERMTYLDQCLNETLRMFPALPFFARRATKDVKLNENFTIPAGMEILISSFMVHRDPKIYNNPNVWNPNNFAPDEIAKRHKFSFLAFSAGQRGCIGKVYAQLEMKTIIATVLKHYNLVNENKPEDLKLKYELALRSISGYNVKLLPRKKKLFFP